MKPFEEQTLVEKLRNRSEIRKKMRANGKRDPETDKIAALLDEAADKIEWLESVIEDMDRAAERQGH